MIAMWKNIYFEKYCSFALREHAQAIKESNHANANDLRVLGCLFLRAREFLGPDLLNLCANKTIDQPKILSAPVAAAVINQECELVKLDRMLKGVEITNKSGLESQHSSWTVGVDRADDADAEENENENENACAENDKNSVFNADEESNIEETISAFESNSGSMNHNNEEVSMGFNVNYENDYAGFN